MSDTTLITVGAIAFVILAVALAIYGAVREYKNPSGKSTDGGGAQITRTNNNR